ncbi:hypothetical protein KM043_005914 [Ampulex compressa]|nr:hypothetical protein KM043_005914 [Ampulex compressa]
MGAIVRQHLRVLSFASHIEDIMHMIVFVELLGCTFLICIIGYCVITCRHVGEMAYMIEWYRLPDQTALDLILIILRSRTEAKLTAGKIVQLSLPTFMNVLKMSVTYLNMLRTLTASSEI